MKVYIANPSGYCAGVSLAISKAKKLRKDYPNRRIVILGMLVHNTDALKELNDINIETLYDPNVSLCDLIDKIDSSSLVILTAHGHPFEVEEKLNKKKIQYLDATCPMVDEIHRKIIDAIKNNHEVIYIGKKNHPEAIAATSISNKVHFYSIDDDNFDYKNVKDNEPLIITQTTLSRNDVSKLIDDIKNAIPNAKEALSVCFESVKRQEALLNLDNNIELILVVGGKHSNNTKTLFEMAKNKYQSKDVLFVENLAELNKVKPTLKYKSAAIISGASTPHYVIEEIANYLKTIE